MYFQYHESILIEFYADGVLEESDLIRFFKKDVKSLIKSQTKQSSQEIDTWGEAIEKTIEAKAKTSLQVTSYIREIDERY